MMNLDFGSGLTTYFKLLRVVMIPNISAGTSISD